MIKLKRNAIIFVTLGLMLLVVGFLFIYLNYSFGKENELKEKYRKINESYDVFEEKLEIITGEREIMTNNVVNNYYIDEVNDNYDKWIKIIQDYNKSIDEINKYKDLIINYCNQEYKDDKVNSKCQSMILGYETAINYFVKDIDNFNKFIEEYNSNYPDNTYVVYENLYNYVDMNDDGNYIGK